MDEPSIGLHQRDNVKLIQALKDLRDLGNSILVVEHDKDMMLESDYIVDIGLVLVVTEVRLWVREHLRSF
jgi:excinuclease ABC subunit A